MARYDFTTPRLFVDVPLEKDGDVALASQQFNYLRNVMRLSAGSPVQVFNGRDGEWCARIDALDRKRAVLKIEAQLRAQDARSHLIYAFAPLKQARLDYLVQKAVEMGAGVLAPVLTQHTQVRRVNLDRMRANVVEACEQCGVIAVPEVRPPVGLDGFVAAWDQAGAGRPLVLCDEGAPLASPLAALAGIDTGPAAVLVGPEGGFSDDERTMLLARPFVRSVALGPRILRADTAAVAILAIIQSTFGDWR